jgi:hypothetical protein
MTQAYNTVLKDDKNYLFVYQCAVPSLDRDMYPPPYQIKKPSNLDVTYTARQHVKNIQIISVREQVVQLLDMIDNCLNESRIDKSSYRLPRIALTIGEDGVIVLEWNFEFFRIGFTLEEERGESSYFKIVCNEHRELQEMETHLIRQNLKKIISELVTFVLLNS